MIKFIIKRLLALIPVLVGVSLLVFFILDLAPGDPAKAALGEQARPEDIEAFREEMGLNDPFIVRYVNYMLGLCQGDLGTSYKTRDPVGEEVWARLPNTAMLALTSTVVAILLALPLGIIAAIKQNTLFDGISMFISLLGISMPVFWMGLLLILFFSVKLGWFDLYGLVGRNYAQLDSWGQFLDKANHLVLPIITLVIVSVGSLMRYTRTNMLEVLNADYIRTARAKGLSEKKVIYHHAFRNTLIPLVTVVGGSLPGLFSGALITETLFAIPGIGYTSYQAMVAGDIPFSMFYMTFLAVLTLAGNLISDILYAVVDPRVRIA